MTPIPSSAIDDEDRFALVSIAVRHCLMPHPDVVAALPDALLPVIRASTARGKRGKPIDWGGERVLCDDNTSPRWALLWSHELTNRRKSGWCVAHVYDRSADRHAYTRLANLCMIPESLAALSDKDGPLVDYLKFHAWKIYSWLPEGDSLPEPRGYGDLTWHYLDPVGDPLRAFHERLRKSKDDRVISLRKIMSELL